MDNNHTSSMPLARVPVCDREFNVLAYELIAGATPQPQSSSLSEVITAVLTDPRVKGLLNGKPALLLTKASVLAQLHQDLSFPLTDFWLMIAAEELHGLDLNLIKKLIKRGARFGIQLSQLPMPELDENWSNQIAFFRAPIKVLQGRLQVEVIAPHWLSIAHGIDDATLFNQLQQLDIKALQGRYLPRPEVAEIKRIPSNKLIALQILSLLGDVNVSLEELESLIVQDLQLYYKLLRFINSAYYNFNRKINSIKEALIYLGLNTLRSITLVIALAESTTRSPDLFYLALTRAKMCEHLAIASGWANESMYFNAGLISLLDVLLEIPMSMILSELPLSSAIKNAVLHFEGRTGAALQCAINYELVDWQKIEDSQFEKEIAHTAYLEASRWATALQQSLIAAVESQEC
ncbi:HDOD domain-containing protein [Oceanospirillum multiglobuliferum]|uniref:HDOD domain-containing protein n=1 Tax=Oceanospirillum multiglobuliferum TaxID=64969 RepID=A0A1T4RRS7_9GAMM|nr:HDOD domain-containing protein [Oceanospirillum multiglobuliferum]OPX54691.1 hypothetical protein BTE48_12990 [Oceanospirillum multiglobuliferum]SKA18351.1 HDOD domain-containing protein [Oceanospirillum multiglobuliferum]